MDAPTPSTNYTGPVRHTYAPGAIVQVLSGDPHLPGADVIAVHDATIQIATDRVMGLVGDRAWTWGFDQLEDVIDSPDGVWTILPVPGVPDHGLAPKPEDAAAFRAELQRAIALARAEPEVDATVDLTEPEPEPEPEPLADPQPQPEVEERAPRAIYQRFDGWSGASLPVQAVDAADSDTNVITETAEPYFADAPVPVVAAPMPAPPSATGLATLEARSISAWFADHNVLDRVSLTMPAGQVTALIGPSGCGKSTFLRILNRMHEMIPSASLAGEVRLDGEDIYDVSKKLTDARRQIGMVFQKPNPFPAMSIYDNVVAGFRLTGTKINNSEKDEVVETCLTKAGLWNEVRDRLRQPGGGLSGGQQQRLCIARSLAIRPRVLLMDEPCSALDPTSTRRIEQTIVELKSEVTIVIVTHNMQQANRVSDQCAFFLAEAGTPGVIVEYGDTEAMFHNPQDERTNAYVNGRFG